VNWVGRVSKIQGGEIKMARGEGGDIDARRAQGYARVPNEKEGDWGCCLHSDAQWGTIRVQIQDRVGGRLEIPEGGEGRTF